MRKLAEILKKAKETLTEQQKKHLEKSGQEAVQALKTASEKESQV